MKKLLATLAISPMAITACGGAKASGPTVKALSGKENTIVFGTSKTEGRDHWNAIKEIVDNYNAQTADGDMKVELQFFAAGSTSKAALASGQVPDIVEMYSDELYTIYDNNSSNVIDLMTSGIDTSIFVDSFLEEGKSVGGKFYNLPYLKSLQVQAVNLKLMNEFIAWNGGSQCMKSDYSMDSCSNLGVSATAFKGKASFTKDTTLDWSAFKDSDVAKYQKLISGYSKAIDHDAYKTSPVITSGFTYSSKFEVADPANPTAQEIALALAKIKEKGKIGDINYAGFNWSTAADTTVVWASGTPTTAELTAHPFAARLKESDGSYKYYAATANNVMKTYNATYDNVSVNGAASRNGQMFALGSDSLSNDIMLASADQGANTDKSYNWDNFFFNASGSYNNYAKGVENAAKGTLDVWYDSISTEGVKFKDVSGVYNSDFFSRNEMLTNTGSTAGAAYLTGNGTNASDLMIFAQPTKTKSIVQQGPGLTIMNLGEKRTSNASKFLKYFATASNLESIAGKTGYVPSTKASFADGSSFRTGLDLTKGPDRMISRTLDLLKDNSGYKAFTYPANKYSNTVRNKLQEELAAILKNAGSKSKEDLIKEFKAKAEEVKTNTVGAR